MKRMNILFAVLFLGSLTFAIVTDDYGTPQVSMEKIQERVEQVATVTENVTATMYNAVTGQCDSDPLVTAGMYKINPNKASDHKWVALSRDLLKRWGGEFDYGDTIRIENAGEKSGTYTVVDTMNARFTKKIDILETTGTDLYKYDNVKIIKIS
jgi:3D (Asp-Asp-Asp) domain-containing protein